MKKRKIINILKLMLIFILFFELSTLIKFIFTNLLNIDIGLFNHKDIVYADLLTESILLFISVLLYRFYLKKDLVIFKLNKKEYISKILNIFILFMGVKILASFATSFISIILGYNLLESENQSIIILLTKQSPILMLISSVILAPIVEEIIFRLSLRKVIDNKYLYIIISGSIFGLMHIFPTELSMAYSLIQSISYVTMGLFLSHTYANNNNIWIVIGVHALNNLISMLSIIAIL